jgi:hypothetical protein
MKKEEEQNVETLRLKASISSIGSVGSGIARMNSKHLEAFGEEVPELIVVRTDEHKKVIKLVSDKLAPKGRIVLRKDDMEELEIDEDSEVDIAPYTKLSDDLRKTWSEFKERFRKDEEEEEEEK